MRFLDKFQNIFGALHIKNALLLVHGQFINGTGLPKLLGLSSLSLLGLENVSKMRTVFVNDVTKVVQCVRENPFRLNTLAPIDIINFEFDDDACQNIKNICNLDVTQFK